MEFNLPVVSLVNILFIAVGIGVCALCILHMASSKHIRKEVRLYFIFFFALILTYISAHLCRELMNGIPGEGIRVGLYIVTFIEMLVAGIMTHMLSLLVVAICKVKTSIRPLVIALYGVLLVHAILLIVGWPLDLIYSFNANNEYQRGTFYLLSNLAPVIMMIIDIVLLIKYRKNSERHVRITFWVYMVAPGIAIVIQSFIPGLQLIIFATVAASVYVFSVILRDQNRKYELQQADKSRIETELTMASSIQADMLPSVFPAFPERPEFDVYASMDPAKEVGGDFYDFFLIDDDHLCVVIADVSGKGVPAALFMMATKIILANNALLTKSPAATLTNANNAICANNREDMFVTAWLGILELSTGKLTAANAGHEYPAICRPNGKFELLEDKHGLVIGAFAGVPYNEYSITLEPGSKIFVYTDGVAEAKNYENKLFKTERLLVALNKNPSGSPRDLAEQVKQAVDEYAQGVDQFDDITMLCVEYKGKQKK